MLQGEHSAILSTFIKLLFVFNTFVLSIFEWPFKTGFTVLCFFPFQVDIFSFGMFMFELLTCRFPLADINNPAVHVCNGGRPNITSEVRTSIYPLYSDGSSHTY